MALSFLAFGGYLLCLIVNAIKEKNMEMMATPAPAAQQFVSCKITMKIIKKFHFDLKIYYLKFFFSAFAAANE